ncbi:MAG TPA: FMN-binding protein [Nocardioides sp.]
MSSLSPARRWLTAVAAVAALSFTAACGVGQSDDASDGGSSDDTSQEQTTDSGSDTGSDTGSESGSYTAGTYEATGDYTSPGGQQSVGVEVTIDADGTITEVEVTPEASDSTSDRYQTQFAGGISDEIVGQAIDELDVSTVAGSSLTSGGFNAAIDDILGQAQA